jgi:hypothetical protein
MKMRSEHWHIKKKTFLVGERGYEKKRKTEEEKEKLQNEGRIKAKRAR